MLGFALYIDRPWAGAIFELGVDDEQLLELDPIFRAAWETRQQAIEQATGAPPGRALALSNAMKQIREEIENGLQEVLTEDQFAEWQEMQAAGPPSMMQ